MKVIRGRDYQRGCPEAHIKTSVSEGLWKQHIWRLCVGQSMSKLNIGVANLRGQREHKYWSPPLMYSSVRSEDGKTPAVGTMVRPWPSWMICGTVTSWYKCSAPYRTHLKLAKHNGNSESPSSRYLQMFYLLSLVRNGIFTACSCWNVDVWCKADISLGTWTQKSLNAVLKNVS